MRGSVHGKPPVFSPAQQFSPGGPVLANADFARSQLRWPICVATVGVLPVFLVGAIAVDMNPDIGISASSLGLMSASFFGASAASSVVGGWFCETMGPSRSMQVALFGGSAVLCGIAVFVQSLGALAVFLAVGGIANAVAQPSTSLYLAKIVPRERQGLAFGVKQTAVPLATLLGGVALPVLTYVASWRWVFGAFGCISFLLGIALASSRLEETMASRIRFRPDIRVGPLSILALGAGLGVAGAGTLGVFVVDSVIQAGMSEMGAGVLLAGSSGLGLATRVWCGLKADRRGAGHLLVVRTMMVLGATGFLGLASGVLGVLVVAVPLAFAAGWGWPGLFMLSVVRLSPGGPAAATGITQTGTSVGMVVGPLAFGALVDTYSYGVAWIASGALLLLAAATIVVGRELALAA